MTEQGHGSFSSSSSPEVARDGRLGRPVGLPSAFPRQLPPGPEATGQCQLESWDNTEQRQQQQQQWRDKGSTSDSEAQALYEDVEL